MKLDIRRFFNLHTLQGKFFSITLIVSLLVMSLSLWLCVRACTDAVEEITAEYMTNYIQFADDALSEKLESAVSVSLAISMDQEIIRKTIQDDASVASYPWYQQYKQVAGFLSGVIADKPYISTAALVLSDGRIYQAGGAMLLKKQFEEPWFQEAFGNAGMQIRYVGGEMPVIQMVRPVIRSARTSAAVMLELDFKQMAQAYQLTPLKDMGIFSYSPAGEMMFCKGEDFPLPTYTNAAGVAHSYQTLRGKRYFVLQFPSPRSGLTTVGLIDTHTMIFGALRISSQISSIAMLCLVLAALTAFIFSFYLCRNLNALIRSMSEVHHGRLDVRAQITARDEIADAAVAFNAMMDRIEGLMEEIRLQEAQKRQAEQDVLSAQIKPHFIYNAISAIQYVASMRGEKDIEEASVSLSELLRSVLGNHDEFITLWEEREYIEHYITLQRFKFQNSFTLLWEVEEELWLMPIPKLLLQPIVENALIHGIAMRKDGVITVSAARKQGMVALRVTDNGRGMDEEMIERCVHLSSAPSSFRHVGLPNVFLRVRTIYGSEAQCRIFSSSNEFTCVEIQLPETKEGAQ